MQANRLNFSEFLGPNRLRWAAAFFLMGFVAAPMIAQEAGQKTFPSAQDAGSALMMAAKNSDEKAMLEILGPGAKQIVDSGDPAEDAANRANFVQRYEQMHRLMKEPDGTTTLYVGPENWPMPIPLAEKNAAWYFDSAAAKREVLYRRIGRNEISTIHVCEELVAAEKEYSAAHNGQYAGKIASDAGQQDGLYWKAAAGQPQSPIGPLVASAFAEASGSDNGGSSPTPYRGYYFRVLARQGAGAPGGAKSYIAGGKMTEGFAFVAYPAEYRSSGVMTFVVGADGVVYRKDLGPNTPTIAKAMRSFNPDSTWKKDEDQQEESAAEQKTN
jgi:Protein of unknown function (DUF2950)